MEKEEKLINVLLALSAVFGIYNIYIIYTSGFDIGKIGKFDFFMHLVTSFTPGTNEIIGDMMFGLYGALIAGSIAAIPMLIARIMAYFGIY